VNAARNLFTRPRCAILAQSMPLNLSSFRLFLTHGLQCRNFPLLLAVILSPLVSKSQGFRGRDRLPVGNISGGSRDWLTSCAISWVDLKERKIDKVSDMPDQGRHD
jgi:hypothetical protein